MKKKRKLFLSNLNSYCEHNLESLGKMLLGGLFFLPREWSRRSPSVPAKVRWGYGHISEMQCLYGRLDPWKYDERVVLEGSEEISPWRG